jgi:hypothetical protein
MNLDSMCISPKHRFSGTMILSVGWVLLCIQMFEPPVVPEERGAVVMNKVFDGFAVYPVLPEERGPVVTGYAAGVFEIGELLFEDHFSDPDNWVVQVESSHHPTQPEVHFHNGSLEMYMPARGATVWFKHKIQGPVAILYDVVAPTARMQHPWVVPRDINVFWHASDPYDADNVLNNESYTGAFSSYHKQMGYYASIGGRENSTTRFRRYPRTEKGSPVVHISLSDKDELEDYLIKPDQTHTIQLVVYGDLVQYIVDGKVFYEIREGDEVTLEASASDGVVRGVYNTSQFPAYDGGWVGLRMVNSHHIYSNFRVFRLKTK